MPRKRVQNLVSDFGTSTDICKMIRNIYSDLESNIFILTARDLPNYIKRSIKFLGLKKDNKKGSILFRRLNSTISIDKLLKNKDIYFGGYYPFGFDKLTYSSQFYAHKKFTKRKNNYYSLQLDTSQVWKNECFDYIICGYTVSLEPYSKDLKLLKRGGRFYTEVRYISKEEYDNPVILKSSKSDTLLYSNTKKVERLPHFTKDSLKEFLKIHGLYIEREKKRESVKMYVFRKA